MNESDGEFQKGLDVMGRIIEIAHSIRCRLDEVPGIEGAVVRRYDETELAKVLPLISREEWVFVCILDLIRVVRNDGSCGYNGLQGYSVRSYLREVGIEKIAELLNDCIRSRGESTISREIGKMRKLLTMSMTF